MSIAVVVLPKPCRCRKKTTEMAGRLASWLAANNNTNELHGHGQGHGAWVMSAVGQPVGIQCLFAPEPRRNAQNLRQLSFSLVQIVT